MHAINKVSIACLYLALFLLDMSCCSDPTALPGLLYNTYPSTCQYVPNCFFCFDLSTLSQRPSPSTVTVTLAFPVGMLYL